jgi:hypothetical protein
MDHSLQLDGSPKPLSKQLKQATAVLENATPILHGNSLSDKPRLDHTLLHKLIGRLRFIRLHTAEIHSRPAVEVTRTMLSSYRLISRRQTPDRRYILYRSHGCSHVVDDVLSSVLQETSISEKVPRVSDKSVFSVWNIGMVFAQVFLYKFGCTNY